MRNIIDAHVHVIPNNRCGTKDEKFNVEFGTYGRITIMNKLTVCAMPQYIENSVFTTDTLVHFMDCMGVETAVILVAPISDLNVVIDSIKKYPERLKGAMALKLDEHCLESMENYSRHGLSVAKFEMSQALGYMHPAMYPEFKFNSTIMKKIFEKAAELGITITIDPNKIGTSSYQVEELHEVTALFPETHFVICHLGVPDVDMANGSDKHKRWEEMLSLAERSNVWFDISAMPAFYDAEGFPFITPVNKLRSLMDKYGAKKFIWGSDIPSTLLFATYNQMINMYEKSGLFTEAEKERIFFENAKIAYCL